MSGASKEDRAAEWFRRGIAAFREGLHGDAARFLSQGLELNPEDVDALHALAMSLLRDGRPEEALEVGRRIAELRPDDALSHTTLSLLFMRCGRIREAEEAAARAKVLEWKRKLREERGEEALDVLEAPPSSPPIAIEGLQASPGAPSGDEGAGTDEPPPTEEEDRPSGAV